MRRLHLAVVIVFILAAGFALGRATGGGSARLTDGAKDIPLFPVPPKPQAVEGGSSEDGTIVVETPVGGAIIDGAVIDIAGRAKLEGGPLRIVVKDAVGTEIAAAQTEIVSTDAVYGRFRQSFTLAVRPVGNVVVSVARTSGAGGHVTRDVSFPDPNASASDTVNIKTYFYDPSQGADADCSAVIAVDRAVPAKSAAYRSALETLLAGPTADERALGYASAIPQAAALKSVAADAAGTVTADFTEALERGVAGACRTSAIRAQIISTLRQFPEVRSVVITVGGRSEGILQP